MTITRIIPASRWEYYEVPFGWAPAYPLPDYDAVVLAPLGLHLLLRWARRFRFWLMWTGWNEEKRRWREQRERALETRRAYTRGYYNGRESALGLRPKLP